MKKQRKYSATFIWIWKSRNVHKSQQYNTKCKHNSKGHDNKKARTKTNFTAPSRRLVSSPKSSQQLFPKYDLLW